jgi:pantetheine-phosphate adenylyltransferase
MRKALFAGSFDPFTLGHLDVVRRGLAIFDRVVVGIGHNPAKQRTLSLETRVRLIEEAVAGIAGVEVVSFEGLTVQFAERVGAVALLRGIRSAVDLEFETPLAHANRSMAPAVETVFVLTDPTLGFVSSSLMREIHGAGGDVSAWLPGGAIAALDRARKSAP